ncbi:MAG: GNAT family N-acetyltransferase [Gammaproteobacteria bacterium]|nr:GNAT family N-acetyltransferase [Gammaproteobacteria bacterium]MDH4314631.1 GNAT family N-acetyltransferase [Gammaproteobacteria bacterium]MDH5212867.1 GNAT family N-acetyltransferase [Gammaproteobacteria bacterium]MDH5499937.1 GNAT family N-acetyltransferase [Gammaproteobacteria bacterium]
MNAATTPVIRAAHISEAALIASASRLHVEYGLQWRWTPSRIRQQIRDPETMVLIASVRGDIAGFAIMHFGDERAHLLLLAVLPQHRRRGIGSAMLRWLEESCKTAGIRHVRLEVRSANRGARDFYARAGYRYLGQISAYYDGRESAAVMARQLFVTSTADDRE